MISEYFELLAAAGAGGGLIFAAHTLLKNIRHNEPLNESAVKVLQNTNSNLQNDKFTLESRIILYEQNSAKQATKIHELEKTIIELKLKIEIMEFAPFHIPLPMWMKNQFHVLDYINDEYEKVFLLPRGLTKEDYLGKTDYEVWPREVADAFALNDAEVLKTGTSFNGREKITDNLGNVSKWRIMKFLRPLPRGVCGIAFPDNGYIEHYLKEHK